MAIPQGIASLEPWAGISERLRRFDYGGEIRAVYFLREIRMVQIVANTFVNKLMARRKQIRTSSKRWGYINNRKL